MENHQLQWCKSMSLASDSPKQEIEFLQLKENISSVVLFQS